MNNKQSWNKQATRYFRQSNFSYDIVDYGDPRCATDDSLRLLPDIREKSVLELGCGGGNIGIALAKRGASVTCVDFSNAQLLIARQKAGEHEVEINFIESGIEQLDYSQFESIDLVISVCALQYVSDLASVFERIYKSLKPSGLFIFSTNDPVFYSIAAKFLWKEEGLPSSYFYDGPETWKWEDSDDFSFTTYRHPIDYYINSLVKTGFVIERFHQLPIHHTEVNTEEEQFEQLYPRLMVFKCRKK